MQAEVCSATLRVVTENRLGESSYNQFESKRSEQELLPCGFVARDSSNGRLARQYVAPRRLPVEIASTE